jgi:hypothetical protein
VINWFVYGWLAVGFIDRLVFRILIEHHHPEPIHIDPNIEQIPMQPIPVEPIRMEPILMELLVL